MHNIVLFPSTLPVGGAGIWTALDKVLAFLEKWVWAKARKRRSDGNSDFFLLPALVDPSTPRSFEKRVRTE